MSRRGDGEAASDGLAATGSLSLRPAAPRQAALLTVDVEDWYHVNYQSWHAPAAAPEPVRVDVNTRRILELCAENRIRGTFFILGCVARAHPGLIREIAGAGHEVACHSLEHDLVYREKSPADFRRRVSEARALLEDAGGQPVLGFRAPSWSITRKSLWALDELLAAGFRYDASLFPFENYMYGLREAPAHPGWITTPGGQEIFEVPAPAVRIGPLRVPHGGGFYLRILPYWAERMAIGHHRRRAEPTMLYVHPREVDDLEIPMPLALGERLIQNARVRAGRAKLLKLLAEVRWSPIREVYGGEIGA
jgi:polysaccharide deacetylase family protein (PEP-CTERM system associated)